MTSDVEDNRWKMKNCITLISKVILGDSRGTFIVNKYNRGGTEGQCNDLEKEK